MRLIDADAFFENYPELAIEPYINAPTVDIPCNDCCADTYRDGYEKGKADARPTGEWKHPYSTDIACECSNCHLQMPITDYFNFCPNCGADMRKGGAE